MTSKFRSHRGFTLVELLVVIAIIGLLVSLLLPAVNAAREAGRRTACINNSRQLGIAITLYHDARGVYPPAHSETGNDGPTYRHQLSWLALCLPYLEEVSLAALIDPNDIDPTVNAHVNPKLVPIGRNVIPTFICPSDGVSAHIVAGTPRDEAGTMFWAPSNYMGNQGIVCNCRFRECSGMFGHGTQFKISQIKDGTSHTIAIGETLKGDLDPDTLEDNYIFTKNANADDIDGCQGNVPNTADRATTWIGGQPHLNMFSTSRAPNDSRIDCKAPSNGCTNFAARSAHPGGAVLVFADGSTHFIADAIDEQTMQALGTRANADFPGAY
ncbi:MAG: DUF1559 domain-containing protein [Pirellulaceae bacterium]|nr:DUF1559 domain-containing protein [Planctomycetales bacterium]